MLCWHVIQHVMHRQDYWTRRTHKLRVYSMQVNTSFKSMSGNTRIELQSWNIWSIKFDTTRNLPPRTWIMICISYWCCHWGRRYGSDWSAGRWGLRLGCKVFQKTCLAGFERPALGLPIGWAPALCTSRFCRALLAQMSTKTGKYTIAMLYITVPCYISQCHGSNLCWCERHLLHGQALSICR